MQKENFVRCKEGAVYIEKVRELENLENLHELKFIFQENCKEGQLGTILVEDGVRITEQSEVLDVWKKHFENFIARCTVLSLIMILSLLIEDKIHEYVFASHECTDDPLEVPFEVEEVAQVVTQLPRGKASGTDGITI